MTLPADLTALLADAGIIDVGIDKAVDDEHVRSHAYQRIISVAAASQRRDGGRSHADARRIAFTPDRWQIITVNGANVGCSTSSAS
ncbi:MAG: hypothetical protein GEV28_04890 [Actinophytocola sp.]|uniref:hypothetical protein n=1 Tax=Actinophytocola sp. TaxID=1872138 RepID=UPI00132A85F7|nr:hypothetical protein [Actinophytocola sp.]MPZ79756.1 hypothetical protein [Actinophytocola sp.]